MKQDIENIDNLLPLTMGRDRFDLKRRLQRLKSGKAMPEEKRARQIRALRDRVRASAAERKRRRRNRPELAFDAALPITARKDDIIQAIVDHPVVIISGDTGSGKTTQIPKFCLAAGRGIDGFIGCTQPRRIAATMVARRIAEELGQQTGESVGYKIRFKDRAPKDAFIKIVTDGILLAEAQSDRYLRQYDTIIVDEAHERSLNIDFVLGILKTLLARRRHLKVIITSATIDTQKFSEAFGNAPVIEVSGRMYPVRVVYPEDTADLSPADNDELTHIDLALNAVADLERKKRSGDILVFMPTEQDIRDTCAQLEGRPGTKAAVLPLYARLSSAEQARIYSRPPGRKIIVSTNLAETSLTIPGIKFVIDTGLARIPMYNPRSRTTAMPVVPISRSSADQRKGRCGRVENGVCIRLFTGQDFEDRPLYTPPEIVRSNLAEVILRMISLRLGDVSDFPFIDPPAPRSIHDGFELLTELGAIAESGKTGTRAKGGRYALTATGNLMARLPIDPRLSRILIEAHRRGCLAELTVIAAALSIQDPRQRPVEKADAADAAQAVFKDPSSDFLSLLNIWNHYHRHWVQVKTQNRMKKYCREFFLSYRRMREWRDIHQQIGQILRENGLKEGPDSFSDENERYAAVHQAIACGFLSSIAVKKEKNLFQAAKGRQAMLFPGSALFNQAGDWIVAAEMVETSRLFARTAARIQPHWLEELGGDLCRRTYLDPHWDAKRGQVTAVEQVSLFGLMIVNDRKVAYGRIDPQAATDIFIRKALVAGGLKSPPEFLSHNLRLADEVRDMEDRIRRRDLLVGEDEQVRFYRDRLGVVYDEKTLQKRLKEKGGGRFLKMRRSDLMLYAPAGDLPDQFPDAVRLGTGRFACSYAFEPGAETDGVSIRVPAASAAGLPADDTDWMVPGLLREKITALLKGLPKTYRRHLVPVTAAVDTIMDRLTGRKGALITTLGRIIREQFGVDIPAAAWDTAALPEHLKMRICITGPDGREIRSGRDKRIIAEAAGRSGNDRLPVKLKNRWEKTGIGRWDFGDLPESIDVKKQGAVRGTVYPALTVVKDAGGRIDLKLFSSPALAEKEHRAGVARLYGLYFSKDIRFLKKTLALRGPLREAGHYFGGPKHFEAILVDTVIETLFRENIRSRKAFEDLAARKGALIQSRGQALLEAARPVLEAALETGRSLSAVEQANPGNHALAALTGDLQTQMAQIAPPHFIRLYDEQRLAQLPRYIRALAMRAERAAVHFDKDMQKAAEVKPFVDALGDMLGQLSTESSEDKRQAVEAYFWLVEEYKVSLFAQELKTAVPVSRKRLEEKIAEIRRMV